MTDADCATFLDALDAVVAGKDLPAEALEAIRRGAASLRVKGMLVEVLERLETDITNITGTAAREFVPHMERVDVDARALEALLAALDEARKTP